MTETAIILAGGLGTRLRSVVPDLPKPMAPVNGRPFLEYQLDYWISQGIRHFILSVGYRRESIMTHFGSRYKEASIEYAIEEIPLGTGGGLMQAARLMPSDQCALVINGDTFFSLALDELVKKHRARESGWSIALFKADVPDRYGKVICNTEGQIESFSPDKAMPGDYANGGIYLLSRETLCALPSTAKTPVSLEAVLLPDFISTGGRCYGFACEGQFFDIGLPQDYHQAANILTGK